MPQGLAHPRRYDTRLEAALEYDGFMLWRRTLGLEAGPVMPPYDYVRRVHFRDAVQDILGQVIQDSALTAAVDARLDELVALSPLGEDQQAAFLDYILGQAQQQQEDPADALEQQDPPPPPPQQQPPQPPGPGPPPPPPGPGDGGGDSSEDSEDIHFSHAMLQYYQHMDVHLAEFVQQHMPWPQQQQQPEAWEADSLVLLVASRLSELGRASAAAKEPSVRAQGTQQTASQPGAAGASSR
jgi:hypothetical protein